MCCVYSNGLCIRSVLDFSNEWTKKVFKNFYPIPNFIVDSRF